MSLEEQEYLKWLTRIESRAIIPLKWAIFFISLFVWFWSTQFTLPAVEIFIIFLLYAMFNVAQSYFFLANRVTIQQVRSFCYLSYFIDIAFITILIYLDATRYYGRNVQSDFYILYFLMILRGFALFRRSRQAILMSILISGLFILSIWFRETSFDFIRQRDFALKFALIWMVSLMSWFIVEMINSQKMELLRIRESLLRSEQFASLGQMAAGVAHEINNPISIISAYADYLMRNTSKDDPRHEDYETMHKEAQRCAKIVSQLLNFANPNARQIIRQDLAKMNEEVLGFVFHDKKDSTVQIEKDIEDNLPEILCDPIQIKQALLNIYINARQAMEKAEEKKIHVQLRRLLSNQEMLNLIIRDSGSGIKKTDIGLIFEPFYTTRKDGTGLGLSITRRIIEGHSGKIEIRNAVPCGAEVDIALPIHTDGA